MKLLLFALLFLAYPVYAQDTETPPAMPLDKQEQNELFVKTITALENYKASIEQQIQSEVNQCMKAFGNPEFCNCIANNAPGNVTFTQYVQFFSYGPEDFDYKTLSPVAKKTFEGIRAARDKCVNWKNKQAN